ncbi:MAG: PfkB family carbohydrate kinase [Kofleriaceae bacterium]
MSRPAVLGVGRIGASIVGLAPWIPDPTSGEAGELTDVAVAPGPGVAVAVQTAARLGCAGRLAGWVGADGLGALVRATLTQAGLDVELVRAAGGSPAELVTVDLHGQRLLQRTAAAPLDLDGVAIDVDTALGGIAAVLLDDTAPAAQLAVAQRARARGVPIVLDLTSPQEDVGELVAFADVVITSERMLAELAPRRDLFEALGELLRLGPRASVVTLGAAGAIGRHGGELVEVPGFPVDVVDVTGAGSVFHGAFVAGLLGELPFARCIELASAAAGLSCQTLGAWRGIPDHSAAVTLATSRR